MTKSKIQNRFKCQIPNIKISVLAFVILIFNLFCALNFGICHLFAQEDNKLVNLTKQIIEAKANDGLYAPFAELKDIYFRDNRYSEFIDFLKSLEAKKNELEPFINYYISLSRYQQLKYLEEKQSWDEYFNQGNNYRDQIVASAEKAIDSTTPKDALNIYARLILWQFHCDQQDVFHEQALSDLMNSVLEYAKSASDIQPIKLAADKLLSYGEKGKSKELYKIFVDKMLASNITEGELKTAALEFYKSGNLELSQILYDAYIERIAGSGEKERLIPVLIDIARAFAYKDKGQSDMLYAEKIFQKIEELGGNDVFDEGLLYLRAYNLEKAKEYARAKDAYVNLIELAPGGAHLDEAEYKTGIIYTYILRDIEAGKGYFERLAQKEALSPQVISALYQLGLLSQWENDFVKAKEYYSRLLEKAKDGFAETVMLVENRIKEIEGTKPLDYNLQTFLGISLKGESGFVDAGKSNLGVSSYGLGKDEEINISSGSYALENGCMQVELQYLWSGELGKTKTPPEQLSSLPAFATLYADSGTKVINLLVISPTGVIDCGLVMVDVH